MRRFLAATTVFLGLTCFAPATARANLQVGLGVSGNFGLGEGRLELPRSAAFDGLVGWRIDASPLELTPELELLYLGDLDGDGSGRTFQVMAGARLALRQGDFAPGIYLHGGLGNLTLTSQALSTRDAGPAVEGGLTFDIWIRDALVLGFHLGATAIRIADLPDDLDDKWLRGGVRLLLPF